MRIRPAAVAGSFYPADPAALAAAVDGHLAAARPDPGPPPRALVVPHAGYRYSGAIAGSGWAAAPAAVARVALIGPAHRVAVAGCVQSGADRFRTPLGDCRVEDAGLPAHAAAHAPEHCLEVQLPFIQRRWPGAAVVPVLAGDAEPAAVADWLEARLAAPGTLLAVSSDLSHYLGEAEARRSDRACAEAVLALDPGAIDDGMACGAIPLRGLLLLARRLGLRPRLLDLRTSGDTAGPRDAVVGYGAFAFS